MNPAVRVSHLSKQYHLGGRRAGYRTLRETIMAAAGALRRRERQSTSATVWALNDVSFDVEPGEVVGVIGRNGAGKSTLLKILSHITEPTSGRIELRGRVGSLLEVGTGFHPELTGRENVFINGAILGMKRHEIARRFDEIVAFAEVEAFLDTPVKHYSSGMYMRLAFAVAAHLEPEILLIDEVLAVGDAMYQRRCVARMGELASKGRTVLFVSHNMDLIPHLCKEAVLLHHGCLVARGPAAEVIETYLAGQRIDPEGEDLASRPHAGDGRARFTRLEHVGPDGEPRQAHVCGDDLIFRIEVDARVPVRDVDLAVIIKTLTGTRLITSWNRENGYHLSLATGPQAIICRFRKVRLRPGHRVGVQLWLAAKELIDSVDDAMVIDVVDSPDTQHLSHDRNQGVVVYDNTWEYQGGGPPSHGEGGD